MSGYLPAGGSQDKIAYRASPADRGRSSDMGVRDVSARGSHRIRQVFGMIRA
jgi:hypothetical protein